MSGEALWQAVADELARHADTMAQAWRDDTVRLGCTCGHQRGTVTKAELAADLDGRMRAYRLHVADAVIAVLNGPQSPPSGPGRAERGGRVSLDAARHTGTLTAMGEHATTDGNGADPTTTEGRR